jgi:hypothetical protein
MKKLKLLFAILIGFLIFSCSSNDDSESNSDIIIGKWRMIEKYESNIQVELETCEPHFYTEYKSDKSIIGDRFYLMNFQKNVVLCLQNSAGTGQILEIINTE